MYLFIFMMRQILNGVSVEHHNINKWFNQLVKFRLYLIENITIDCVFFSGDNIKYMNLIIHLWINYLPKNTRHLSTESWTYHSKNSVQGEEGADVGGGCHVNDGSYGAQIKYGGQSLQQGQLVRLGAVHIDGTAQSWREDSNIKNTSKNMLLMHSRPTTQNVDPLSDLL